MADEDALAVRYAASIPIHEVPNSKWRDGHLIWCPKRGQGVITVVSRFRSFYNREIVTLTVSWGTSLGETFQIGSPFSTNFRFLPHLDGTDHDE